MVARAGQTIQHSALLYSSTPDAARRIVGHIHETLDDDGAVLVILDDEKADEVATGLGSRATRVTFMPRSEQYARPICAVEGLAQFIAESQRGGVEKIHAIGEVTLDGSDRDADWLRYEAACNDIFADAPLRATCLYPRTLGAEALAAVARTHPYIDDDHGIVASPTYAGAYAGCAHLAPPRLAPLREPDLSIDDVADPRKARHTIVGAVSRGGRSDIADSAALVVSELVTNAILHGGGHASLALWLEPSSVFVMVRDDGPGIDDPFAGLRPPSLPERGAGLWVAHHLSERVAIDRSPAGGAAITVELAAPCN